MIDNEWAGPTDKIWNDMQCKKMINWYEDDLEECKKKCYNDRRCNSFIFGSGNCNLRDCPSPIPEPISYKAGHRGYYRLSGKIKE